MYTLAYKSAAAVASGLQKDQTDTALSTHCYSSRAAFVSVVSPFRVHFLTLIDNYPKSQRASTAHTSFPSFPCAWIHYTAFVSVVSSSFIVSGGKVNTFIPNGQTILENNFLKSVNGYNGLFRVWKNPLQNICFLYVFVRVRARTRTYTYVSMKIFLESFFLKVVKLFGR